MNPTNVYMLLKPEVKSHIITLDNLIAEKSFSVISRCHVPDWHNLSLQIYEPKLKADKNFSNF